MRCIKIKLIGLTVRFLIRDFHISQRIYYIYTAIVIWISCDYPANYPAHMSAMIKYQMTTLLASQTGVWHISNTCVILTMALALTHSSTVVITKSLSSTDDLNTNLSWRHWTWCWSHISPVVIFIPTSISIPISPRISPPRLRGMWLLNQQHLCCWHLQASLSPNSLTIGAAAKWQGAPFMIADNCCFLMRTTQPWCFVIKCCLYQLSISRVTSQVGGYVAKGNIIHGEYPAIHTGTYLAHTRVTQPEYSHTPAALPRGFYAYYRRYYTSGARY